MDDVVLRLATEKEIADVTLPPPEQRPDWQPTDDWRNVGGLAIRDMDVAANANMTLKLQVPPLEKATELNVFFMDKDGNRIRNSLITFSLPTSQTAQTIDYPILTSFTAVRLRAWFAR